MRRTDDTNLQLTELFNLKWPETDPADLLSRIENCIYDNPRVLDDYATDFIIRTPRTAWAPNSIIEEEEDAEHTIFSSLFPGCNNDVSIDRLTDFSALFCLTPGLENFIGRTIPGARIRSHLAIIVEKFYRVNRDSPRIYVDIRENEVDIALFNRRNFLSATTRRFSSSDDIIYFIFHLINTYGIDPKEIEIYLWGIRNLRLELTEKLRKFCHYVAMTTLPGGASDSDLALAEILNIFG